MRAFCHGVGFQSDSMEAPSVELSLLGTSIVVLQADERPPRNATEAAKLAKLVDSLHAYQARVLVRHITSWEDVKQLARLAIDLISVDDDKREASEAPRRT